MMKANRELDTINEIQSIQGIHPLFCDQVRFFVDIAISKYDFRKSWHDQGHRQGQWPRSYMKQTIQFIYTAFVSCKADHAF